MTEDIHSFEEQFTIRANEINTDKKATLSTICNLLQEIAGNNARQLEFDITDLQENKLTWILYRLNVQMDRFPEWRETITIKTWPSGGDGLRAWRDFLIFCEDGKEIGRSVSYWLMMNIESRRPVRIPEKILQMAPEDIDHVLPLTDTNFSSFDDPDNSLTFEVRKSDLDLNMHVNNVQYIDWMEECLPDDIHIWEFDIQFKAEATYGETVTVEFKSVSAGNRLYMNQILKEDRRTILALAKTKTK